MRRRRESMQPPRGTEPQVFLPLPHLPLHILLVLAEGPSHGWGVVEKIDEISQGQLRPSTGSLYLAIKRLRDGHLIEEAPQPSTADSNPRSRRHYRLTPLGRDVLEAETRRLRTLVQRAEKWSPGAKSRRKRPGHS